MEHEIRNKKEINRILDESLDIRKRRSENWQQNYFVVFGFLLSFLIAAFLTFLDLVEFLLLNYGQVGELSGKIGKLVAIFVLVVFYFLVCFYFDYRSKKD